MLGDEGGGWIWSTPEPSGTGQRISTILPLCKNFFAAGIRAGGHFRCRKPARVAKPWPKDETCWVPNTWHMRRPHSWAIWVEIQRWTRRLGLR